MRATRFAISLAAALALSACDYFGGTPQEAAGDAGGEVLPGSISDEMIATQDLKSQPPTLAVQPGEGGSGGAEAADSAAVDSAAAGGETVTEPAPAEAAGEE